MSLQHDMPILDAYSPAYKKNQRYCNVRFMQTRKMQI